MEFQWMFYFHTQECYCLVLSGCSSRNGGGGYFCYDRYSRSPTQVRMAYSAVNAHFVYHKPTPILNQDYTSFNLHPPLQDASWNKPYWTSFQVDNPMSTSHTRDVYYQQQRYKDRPKDELGMRAVIPWLVGMSFIPHYSTQEGQTTGLRERIWWRQIDFNFPSLEVRNAAIETKKFIPKNNLPLGLEVWGDRIFVTFPKWKPGIPATLGYVSKNGGNDQIVYPYPNWKWHDEGNCNGLTSVFRVSLDPCGRLWVLDSGVIDVLNTTHTICPPQIVVFDVRHDKLVWRYRLPREQTRESSVFTNIVTDVRNGKCDEAFAYVTDVFRYAIVVYDWKQDRSWRISHNLFYPDPIACKYTLDGLTFRWTDGIFGLALSPIDPVTNDRTLYFHPMSSYREFTVPVSILRNETAADDNQELFQVLGEPRGDENYHSSASGMDRNGILFYNLVTRDSVGCWNSRLPYKKSTHGSIGTDSNILSFPNDLKVDQEKRQSVWILSNKLHKYLYSELNPEEVNYRILSGRVSDVVKGTVCDPQYNYQEVEDDTKQCTK